MATRPSVSIAKPGADPCGLSKTAAPCGVMAWRLLLGAIAQPCALNRSSIARRLASWSTSGRFVARAIASRVRSSTVGPRPPAQIATSARASASRTASAMRCSLSPTDVSRWTFTPTAASDRAIVAVLVSTRWPSSSSVPIVMISAEAIGLFGLEQLYRNAVRIFDERDPAGAAGRFLGALDELNALALQALDQGRQIAVYLKREVLVAVA